jgi:KaiC/GvpD/RAD55 family RecA-like ATPase
MVLIAAEGVGKSVVALNWALEIVEHPVLYITLDTSMTDQAIRVIARHNGTSINDVMRGHDDMDSWADQWEPYLEQVHSRTRFFDRDVGPRVVEEVVEAEAEYWGEPPVMTIIDNAGNLIEKEESAQEYQGIFNALHRVAKNQQTFILALHHLRRKPAASKKDREEEQDDPGIDSVHASDILYAGGRNANFVLGVSRPQPDRLRVNVLKNRMGLASSSGKVNAYLTFDGARARVGDVGDIEMYRHALEA